MPLTGLLALIAALGAVAQPLAQQVQGQPLAQQAQPEEEEEEKVSLLETGKESDGTKSSPLPPSAAEEDLMVGVDTMMSLLAQMQRDGTKGSPLSVSAAEDLVMGMDKTMSLLAQTHEDMLAGISKTINLTVETQATIAQLQGQVQGLDKCCNCSSNATDA